MWGGELGELCARELRRAGLPESVCSRPPFMPTVFRQVYLGAIVEKFEVQRPPGLGSIRFCGSKMAEASEPLEHHPGALRLAVYQTDRGTFVVELERSSPNPKQCRTFAWEWPTLEAACNALRPGRLTDQVLEQLARITEPSP